MDIKIVNGNTYKPFYDWVEAMLEAKALSYQYPDSEVHVVLEGVVKRTYVGGLRRI